MLGIWREMMRHRAGSGTWVRASRAPPLREIPNVAAVRDRRRGDLGPTSGTIWRVTVTGDAQVVARGVGRPRGLAVLADGRVAMADPLHHLLSILDPAAGTVTPVAGDGGRGGLDADAPRSAKLSGLEDLDADGARLVVADGDRGDGAAYHHVRARSDVPDVPVTCDQTVAWARRPTTRR